MLTQFLDNFDDAIAGQQEGVVVFVAFLMTVAACGK
jgi:hypothetical protein